MSEIHQVTLEILRHGPAHNQLLSPLTQYLVLCGNHSPETLTLPWEHQELMAMMRTLRYRDSDYTLDIERRTIGRRLAGMLGDIKSLISELSPRADRNSGQVELTELRLVLSSEELALIPFELALMPEGCPGAGEALVLQNRAPLILTRQVRRVNNRKFSWPKETRILFVAASPSGQIPVEAHLLALRRALAPWIPKYQDETVSQSAFAEMVTFLPNASWTNIAEACRNTDFSHVHVLAHGQAIQNEEGVERFGLALHADHNPNEVDLVDGRRLADALRGFRQGNSGRQSGPAVVTLATCDSGSAGPLAGVLGTGSSLAHTLHESGVPLVMASQFPLSFKGSAVFAATTYEELLCGNDPRLLMAKLRRQLHGAIPKRHDWASLVCYCAWPLNLEEQLAAHRLREANRSARVALSWADALLEQETEGIFWRAEMNEAQDMAKLAIEWLNDLSQDPLIRPATNGHDLVGMLASAEKRLAEVIYKTRVEIWEQPLPPEAAEALSRSRSHYRSLFEEDPPKSWAIVQFLVLEMVLAGSGKKKKSADLDDRARGQLASTARWMSEHEVRYRIGKPRAWALASLIELQLLALQEEPYPSPEEADATTLGACNYAKELVKGAREWPMEVYSTRRQMKRYNQLFRSVLHGPWISGAVKKILDILPELDPDLVS